MKSKVVIVGETPIGKIKEVDVYELMHSTAMEVTIDKVPFDRLCRIALDPGRADGQRDTYTGSAIADYPSRRGGDKKKGTVHIKDAAFRDFQGNSVYTATLTAYVFNPDIDEDIQEVGELFVIVRDLIPE